MAEKLKRAKKKINRKQARTEIYEKLSGVLAGYKNGSDPRKFDRNLKKASKLFATLIFKHAVEQTGK